MNSKQHSRTAPPGDSSDDIPFALRDPLDSYIAPSPGQFSRPPGWVLGLILLIAVATLGSALWIFNLRPQGLRTEVNPTNPSDAATPAPEEDSLLGHRPYAEADPATLVAIDDRGEHKLKEAAATAFVQMQDAAKADGISLVPLSAYRSIEDQQYLFFEVKSIRALLSRERRPKAAPSKLNSPENPRHFFSTPKEDDDPCDPYN